jgi:hypothetical protein
LEALETKTCWSFVISLYNLSCNRVDELILMATRNCSVSCSVATLRARSDFHTDGTPHIAVASPKVAEVVECMSDLMEDCILHIKFVIKLGEFRGEGNAPLCVVTCAKSNLSMVPREFPTNEIVLPHQGYSEELSVC